MHRRNLLKIAAGATFAGLMIAGAAVAQEKITIGASAPKTGPLAGGDGGNSQRRNRRGVRPETLGGPAGPDPPRREPDSRRSQPCCGVNFAWPRRSAGKLRHDCANRRHAPHRDALMPKAIRLFVRYVDAVNYAVGRFAMYLFFVLGGILLYATLSRLIAGVPVNWALEMSQFLLSAYYLLGGAYSMQLNGHVRMDLLYNSLPPRKRALTDAFTILLVVFYQYIQRSLRDVVRVVASRLVLLLDDLRGARPHDHHVGCMDNDGRDNQGEQMKQEISRSLAFHC